MKKLLEEELQQIRNIQSKNQAILTELGEIELLKLKLKERKSSAINFLKELEEEEKILAQHLEEVYGKGTISLDKGEFTSLQE